MFCIIFVSFERGFEDTSTFSDTPVDLPYKYVLFGKRTVTKHISGYHVLFVEYSGILSEYFKKQVHFCTVNELISFLGPLDFEIVSDHPFKQVPGGKEILDTIHFDDPRIHGIEKQVKRTDLTYIADKLESIGRFLYSFFPKKIIN